MVNEFVERRAHGLLENGLSAVEEGDYIRALHEFKASAYVDKSPEALTYWGWMEHHLGDTDKAIELCKDAIDVDPDYGNPYNDIGSYLVVVGRREEAVDWFKKAIAAKRYGPRQFPHLNLGKLYMAMKQYKLALHHFEEAQRYDPHDRDTEEAIRTLKNILQ